MPKGAKTSRFQSSSIPSQRVRVLTEYALAPVFGASSVCCTLGTTLSPIDFSRQKGELRSALAAILGLPESKIDFGPVVRLRAQQYYQRSDYFALRKDEAGAVLASALVDVVLSDDVDVDLVSALGEIIHLTVAAGRSSRPALDVGGDLAIGEQGAAVPTLGAAAICDENAPLVPRGESKRDEATDALAQRSDDDGLSVAATWQALQACGVTYVELPTHRIGEEAPDVVPSAMCGVEVTEEVADAAVERWAQRVVDAER